VGRLTIVSLLLLAALAGAPEGARAQCLPFVRWDGRTYDEATVEAPVTLGAAVQGATGGCADFRDDTARPVAASQIAGVRPEIALARDEKTVELAQGFPLEFRAHPLHAALGVAEQPLARCAHPRTIRGTTRYLPGWGAGLLVYPRRGKRIQVEISPDTTYSGVKRFGLPYVPKHARVRATGCPVTRFSRYRMLSASRLTVARP
jgi:hypothetical protein